MTIRSQPTLRDLLDLGRQLELDREATPSSLQHRDRQIGREAPEMPSSPAKQVLYWLEFMRADNPELAGDRINTLHRLGLLILATTGALAGWGASAVVFRYDGSHPVNVINVLVVLVAIQLVMLLFFVLSVLPTAVTRWLPGMGTLREIMSLISPGRIQHSFNRFLPQAYRDSAGTLLGKGIAHGKLYGSVERWITIHSSQTFAVFFNLGALASVLYLVAFSDLAFSWSTTLQVEAADLQRWTDLLSAPWAGLFSDARPSLQLIESTRYFRLQEGSFPSAVSPLGLGGWWPFLIMSMIFYGLAPRLVTWLVARQRLRSALSTSFRSLPGVGDVLARLNSELVETAAGGQENGVADFDGDVGNAGARIDLAGRSVAVIDWSATFDDEAATRTWLGQYTDLNPASWNRAGGALPFEQDALTIDEVVKQVGVADVLVLVKAWEPPMADLFDFLRELRARVRSERMILIAPVGVDEVGAASPADSEEIDTWRHAVARTGDPWMHVLWLGEAR